MTNYASYEDGFSDGQEVGYEMARKEILDKIDKLITKWKDWYRFDVVQIDENWISEMEELKQSLEENKK